MNVISIAKMKLEKPTRVKLLLIRQKTQAFCLCAIFFYILCLPINAAAESRFDTATSTLSIACAAIVGSTVNTSQPAYSLELSFDGQLLQLINVTEIELDTDCSGSFDMATSVLSDSVRLLDDIYSVSLQLQADASFTIGEAAFLRRGDTSLWRVSNGVNEVIVGGTIHVLRPESFPLPAAYQEAYEQTEILVTEVSLADQNNTNSYINLLRLTDGTRLQDRLSASVQSQLSAYLQSAGFGLVTLSNYTFIRPNWVASDITNGAIRSAGFGSGVDSLFMGMAAIEGRTAVGLETTASQIIARNSINQHLTDDQLVLQAIATAQSGLIGPELDRLARAWREGDVAFLVENVIEPSRLASLADYNTIYTNRNENWIPQIEAFLTTSERELVLVGVGHLVGQESVLQMLETLGYTVTRY